MVRSMEDGDLDIVFERAMKEGAFSRVDFLNCNDADLVALRSRIFQELSLVFGDLSLLKRSTAVTKLFTAVTEESTRRLGRAKPSFPS